MWKTGGCRAPDPNRDSDTDPLMKFNEDAFFIGDYALAIADGLGGTKPSLNINTCII